MKCIIIEGPQGIGKTTLVNYLRENIPSSNLYRLSGIKDKTITGKEKNHKMYLALFKYMEDISNSDINLIFDRHFFSEQVYSSLGFKDYDFTDVYEELLDKFSKLNYDVYYFSLYLNDINIYKKRLERESHHGYQSFSIESSVKQQEAYKKLLTEVKKLKNTKVFEIAMDDFVEAYKEINKILNINSK